MYSSENSSKNCISYSGKNSSRNSFDTSSRIPSHFSFHGFLLDLFFSELFFEIPSDFFFLCDFSRNFSRDCSRKCFCDFFKNYCSSRDCIISRSNIISEIYPRSFRNSFRISRKSTSRMFFRHHCLAFHQKSL